MSQSKTRTWAKWTAGLSMLGLVAGVAGCGKSETTESGETHFVVCKTEQDCSSTTGAKGCDGGYCVDQNGDKIAVNSSTSNPPEPGPAACAGGCGDSECGAPGSCTLAAACKVVDCDSAIFDDQACVRPSCASDSDCADDERCTAVSFGKHYQCAMNGAACECTAGKGLFPLTVCSPVTIAGPRGVWDFIIARDNTIGMVTEYDVMPDGAIVVQKPDQGMGIPAPEHKQLSAEDLAALVALIDGPNLRHDLADMPACDPPKSRDLVVELSLNGSSYSKNIAGCQDVPSFDTLMTLLQRY